LKKYLKCKNYKLIKNPLIQTYFNKKKIPKDVFTDVKKYAPDYTHIVLDDDEIISFLGEFFNDSVVKRFKKLKGAYKADLARYCLLYIYGGLYLDIKTKLVKPIKDIFNKGDIFYSVLSRGKDHIYQGVIKTLPRNPIFLSLIDFMMNYDAFFYTDYCKDLYFQIKQDTQNIKVGLNHNIKSDTKYYLFEEKCSKTDDSMCYDGFDRYGWCCFIWDGTEPVIKTRRSSYPW
jgi:hypothetical protein